MKSHRYLDNFYLFNGIPQKNIKELSKVLQIKERDFTAGSIVLSGDDLAGIIAIVIYGKCQIIQKKQEEKTVLADLGKMGVFHPEISCSLKRFPDIYMEAVQYSKVIFLNLNKITAEIDIEAPGLSLFLKNLLVMISRKTVFLKERIQHITQKTTGQKLLSYLMLQGEKSGSSSFTIPMDRQQLADYLCVERSAMSVQLSKLKEQGLIDFKKNSFVLKKENG